MIGVSIKEKTNKNAKTLKSYLEPKKVYINYTENDNISVIDNNEVAEGDIIARNTITDMPIIAPISGITKINHKKKLIEIKNSFKKIENKEEISYDYTYTKTELLDLMKKSGIVGMSKLANPTYLKYDSKKKIKTLIVNAVECEPYATCDYVLALNNAKEIIKTINWIMKTFAIKECFIALTVKNHELKEKLFTIADKYKKIKVIEVPNLYPMGWERTLVRYLKHIDYKDNPIEKGIVINNIATIYAIGESMKYKKPLTSRIVTVEGIEEPCNINVKIGTSIKEILDYLEVSCNDKFIVTGGAMMGKICDFKSEYIKPTTNSILIKNKEEYIKEECIRCGKCIQNCPVKLSPILIKENENNKKALKYLHPEKCIECGICSFICPSKIDLREEVKNIKKGETE